jgi:hypothetical protein
MWRTGPRGPVGKVFPVDGGLQSACSGGVRLLMRKACPQVWKVLWITRKDAVRAVSQMLPQASPEVSGYAPEQRFCLVGLVSPYVEESVDCIGGGCTWRPLSV